MASNQNYNMNAENDFGPREYSDYRSGGSTEQSNMGRNDGQGRFKNGIQSCTLPNPQNRIEVPRDDRKFPVMVQIQYKNETGVSDGGHELLLLSKNLNLEQLKMEIAQRFKDISMRTYEDRSNLINHNLAWTDEHKICSIKVAWHLAPAWTGASISETYITEKNLNLAFACMDRHNCVDTLCVLLCVPNKG